MNVRRVILTNSKPKAPGNVCDAYAYFGKFLAGGDRGLAQPAIVIPVQWPLWVCAVTRLRFPVGASPTRRFAPASGLRLLPRDTLKVGQLVLADGTWKGRHIVPAEWVKRATMPVVTIEGRRGYGYQWYTGTLSPGTPRALSWASGIGWGGQRLFVAPQLELVIAMNAGNYSLPIMEQGRIANLVLYEAVLPPLV